MTSDVIAEDSEALVAVEELGASEDMAVVTLQADMNGTSLELMLSRPTLVRWTKKAGKKTTLEVRIPM